MHIRAETIADYAAIARLHTRAFDTSPQVALIVTLHRQRPRFDPDLSLLAEVDGQVVGHVLFSPQTIRLLGQALDVIVVSPVGVDPAFQRQGIGGALMEAGHRVARDKGYPLCFLIGHPEYYPRFGYRQRVFGAPTVTVTADQFAGAPLDVRAPVESDIPALRGLWLYEEGNVDFAIDPGTELLDWLSPNPAVQNRVYLRDGDIVGYTRAKPGHVMMFLARDGEAARTMARLLADGTDSVTLPLHPASASSAVFGSGPCDAWDAAMALRLGPSIYDDFIAQLERGERQPGRALWPVAYELE